MSLDEMSLDKISLGQNTRRNVAGQKVARKNVADFFSQHFVLPMLRLSP